jgi:hypothetical protein
MADTSQDDSRVADSIIEKVAQEQAYQDLQDRLKAVEDEFRKERQEKDKIKAERDELGKVFLWSIQPSTLTNGSREQLRRMLNCKKLAQTPRSPLLASPRMFAIMKIVYG